ncbi:MAG: M23 family metallopeptidase [Myxococcota bacterium]
MSSQVRLLAPLLLAAALAGTSACDEGAPGGPAVPDDHPCPDRALPPEEPSLWEDAADRGEPVPLTLLVPLDEGRAASVTQANRQAPTHEGDLAWAWDLDVPVGTTVHAAAPGIVVLARDDSTRHGPGAEYREDANQVVLDHGGGLYTAYVHLAPDGVFVSPGQRVEAGAVLGETGLSGRMTGPHLHFHVENAWSRTLPARFVRREAPFACERRPRTGDGVIRPAGLRGSLVGPEEPSPVPEDAFADLGVEAIRGMPARLVERDATLSIYGRAAPGADRVFVMIFPEGGGDALLWLDMEVRDGRFGATFSIGAAKPDFPPGRYGWAAVAVPEGEEAFAPRAIRLTVVE